MILTKKFSNSATVNYLKKSLSAAAGLHKLSCLFTTKNFGMTILRKQKMKLANNAPLSILKRYLKKKLLLHKNKKTKILEREKQKIM